MNTEDWPVIEQHLISVVTLDVSARQKYWKDRSVAPQIREEVENLLLRQSRAEALTSDWRRDFGDVFPLPSEDPVGGTQIGPYLLTRELGQGGMGHVWAATQKGDGFEREVAVKVLRSCVTDVELRERFLMERQILGELSHPSITRLYDVGITAEGLPYLVMELVDGRPIDRFCRERRLDITSRLALFEEICDAVEHAHRNLVIHRDLKPSNILVTDEGEPKLLDFGIAKVLPSEWRRQWVETQGGMRMLTPRYAAPEQVRGESITTATDIYSLGILLYELLSEKTPYLYDTLDIAAFESIWSAGLPTPPSRISSGPAFGVASGRDLDAVVFKAMRQNPAERYGTVDALRSDVRRWRCGLPVSAKGDHWAYLAGRYVSRYRTAALSALAALLLFVAFSFQLARQEVRLKSEEMVSSQVSELMAVIFEGAGAEVGSGQAAPLAEALEVAARRFPLLETPAPVQAAIREALGRSFLRLFRPYPALKELTEALRLRRLELGQEEHPLLAATLQDVGWAHYYAGKLESSERILRSALEMRSRLHGRDSLQVAETSLLLSRVLKTRGEIDESRIWIDRALLIRERRLGEDHPDTFAARSDLAAWWRTTGNLGPAEQIWRDSIVALRSEPGHRVELARALTGLATVLSRHGLLEEVESLAKEALEIRRDHFGESHPFFAEVLGIQAEILRVRGDTPGAEALMDQYLRVCEAVAGPNHFMAARARAKLAMIRYEDEPSETALSALDQEIALASQLLGDQHGLVERWRSWRLQAQRALASG